MFILFSFVVRFTAESAEDAEKNPCEGKTKINLFASSTSPRIKAYVTYQNKNRKAIKLIAF
jgi:hypothetical protein